MKTLLIGKKYGFKYYEVKSKHAPFSSIPLPSF